VTEVKEKMPPLIGGASTLLRARVRGVSVQSLVSLVDTEARSCIGYRQAKGAAHPRASASRAQSKTLPGAGLEGTIKKIVEKALQWFAE